MAVSFQVWLTDKLLASNPDIDCEVFVTYLSGILESDESTEEKKESMGELLAEVSEDADVLCVEILQQWSSEQSTQQPTTNTELLEDKMSRLLGQADAEVAKVPQVRVLTAEERAHKAAIIAQYGDVCDGDPEHYPSDPGGAASDITDQVTDSDLLAKNTNSVDVLRVEREKRDKAKDDHEKKKQRDKDDREAQRQKQQERKESEKKRTQKGERKR